MRRAYRLLYLGIWVTVLPYLGFNYFWKDVLFTISGLGIIYFSYVLYREAKANEPGSEKIFDNFLENNQAEKKDNE